MDKQQKQVNISSQSKDKDRMGIILAKIQKAMKMIKFIVQ